MNKTKDVINDCPLNNPAGHIEGSDGHFVPYTTPCPDWDNGICHWFNPHRKVSELLDFHKGA